jgi:hypothetical protein
LLLVAFACLLALPGSHAQAAHPLRLTDYSDGHRLDLEIAYGTMQQPLPATFTHYLLGVDANVYPGLHVRLGIPFSGYSGIGGADNFIRGNLMLGTSFKLPLADWVSLGAELRLYLPTYERAEAEDFGLPQDPRRAVLTHWHYRFQYALEDSFPVTPSLMLAFNKLGFFAQFEGGFTWAAALLERADVPRKDQVWIGHWGAMAGYDLFGYVELSAGFTGLVDATRSAANMADLIGRPYDAPNSLSAAVVGLRAQYKWAVFRFEANLPLEPGFRRMLDPWYLFALQAQFP